MQQFAIAINAEIFFLQYISTEMAWNTVRSRLLFI